MIETVSPRVLIVDDEPEICRFLETYARDRGWRAVAVSDPGRAGDVALSLQPDAIILDIVMPEMDGFEVLRRLADDGCRSEILLLTSHSALYGKLAAGLGAALGLKGLRTANKPACLDEITAFLAGVHDEVVKAPRGWPKPEAARP